MILSCTKDLSSESIGWVILAIVISLVSLLLFVWLPQHSR